MKKTFAILLLITTYLNLAQAADDHYWMRFKAKNKIDRSKIADIGLEIESVVEDSVMTVGNAEDLENAKKSNLLDMYFKVDVKTKNFPDDDANFHTYNELRNEMQNMAEKNPNFVKLSSIGNSGEGRELMLLTLSKEKDDMSLPAVIFMGGHHAREHISIEMPLELAKFLIREYKANNPRVVKILNTRSVYIVPMVNPDGAEYDISTGNYKLWRKNRRNNGGSYGVDLNRNYGYGWGGGGASTNPNNDTFRGPAAFSEPETQAVKSFFESHKNIAIDLSFHTFSELILYPWGHTFDKIENQQDYLVHKTMAETMAKWNGYTPEQSSELYIASGDTTDWAYGQLGIISFTFELDPKMSPDMNFNPENGFYPGQSQIAPTFQKNLEPCLYLLEYSNNPYRVLQSRSLNFGFNSPILK